MRSPVFADLRILKLSGIFTLLQELALALSDFKTGKIYIFFMNEVSAVSTLSAFHAIIKMGCGKNTLYERLEPTIRNTNQVKYSLLLQ